jgi:single-strand DNA-binding protein
MNVVILTGNLARDPEVRYGQNGLAIAHFTVAVNRMARQGEENTADFIRVTAFGKQAELVEKYLGKGRKVGVEGRIQTGSYEKDGQRRYTTDVIANRVEFLDSRRSGDSGSWSGDAPRREKPASPQDYGQAAEASGQADGPGLPPGIEEFDDDDDDLPF